MFIFVIEMSPYRLFQVQLESIFPTVADSPPDPQPSPTENVDCVVGGTTVTGESIWSLDDGNYSLCVSFCIDECLDGNADIHNE